MGYYDGLGGISTKGSAYDLAGMTKTPVLLVVDAKGMSVSALAFIKVFVSFVLPSSAAPLLHPDRDMPATWQKSRSRRQGSGVAAAAG